MLGAIVWSGSFLKNSPHYQRQMLPLGKGVKKAFQPNGARRDVESVLIINNVEFKAKLVKRDESELQIHHSKSS